MLQSEPILLLAFELNLLEVFQRLGQVSQLTSHRSVLLSQLIHLALQVVHVVHYGPVAIRHVKQGLDAVILLVEEVNLIL